MGRPGMCPLTGRAPAPTDSEGFSEPTMTTDRAGPVRRGPDRAGRGAVDPVAGAPAAVFGSWNAGRRCMNFARGFPVASISVVLT